MESLAYVHMALEYDRTLLDASNSEPLICQQPAKKQTCHTLNWWPFKLFRLFPKRQSNKLINH